MAVAQLDLDTSNLQLDSLLDFTIITSMSDDFYKDAFEAALKELRQLSATKERLSRELVELDKRSEDLRLAAAGLTPLAGLDFDQVKAQYPDLFAEQITSRIGITDAVRDALSTAGKWLTVPQIRDRVFTIAPMVAGHKNPLASIHAVLRRLQDADEVLAGDDGEGKGLYAYIGTDEAVERVAALANDEQREEFLKTVREKRARKTKASE